MYSLCINVWVVLSSQQDKVKNHAHHNIYNMVLQFIKCFWKPHLAFPYSPPSSGTISTIPYFSAPSHSCSLLFFPGNPRQKLWWGFFFFRRSICKIGIFASELAEVGQAGGKWAQVPAQPTSVTTAPLRTGMGLSVIPAARYLSALHSTHTRKWKGCFSCSHRVWTLLSRGCETPQCFVLLTVGFWPVSNASPKKTPTQTSYTIQIVGWEMPVPQLWINQM